MARDLGRFGIRVVTVAPAFTKTPMLDPLPKEILEWFKTHSPLNRIAEVEEVAHVIKTVVENSYLNGVDIKIDGGQLFPHTVTKP